MSVVTNGHSHSLMFQCNSCGTTEDTGRQSFAMALDAVKAEGWRVVKDGETWKHLCPDCEEVA